MNQWRPILIGLSLAVVAFGVWLRGQKMEEPGVQDPRTNVVVVMACTTRKDQLTPYGAPAHVTPHLQQLAEQGALFEDLVAASSWTKESAVALFTGHMASDVGMIEPGPAHSARVLSEDVPTLAQRLAVHGWHTVGVTANPHLNSAYGLDQGFQAYEDTNSRGFSKAHRVHGSEVVERALALVDDRPTDKPLYMRLVIIDPHAPLDITPEQVEPFATAGLPNRLARYRVGLNRMDAALSALDQGLASRGFTPENTLLVVVTDHGEGLSLPEHHRGQHGRVLYPTLTEVPWVLRGPGVHPGRRVQGLASHLDLTPTLLGLLDLPADPSLDGHDWSQLVRSEQGVTTRQEAWAETWYFAANRAVRFTADHACQKDFGSVVDHDSFQDGCFSRSGDPTWLNPIDDPQAMQAIDAWRAERFAAYEAWPDTTDADHQVGVGTKAQLKALGYVE